MTLHFAYGSNMSRALMRARCPQAQALGVATLASWRYVMTVNGCASIVPAAGHVVHGVLWRLSPRDRAAIDLYEDVESGTYRRRMMSVLWSGRRTLALAYIARAGEGGRPKPGYQALVLEAAREWGLPDAYVAGLARCTASKWSGARAPETGEAA